MIPISGTRVGSLDLGLLFRVGADHHPRTRIVLDHDLALYPEAGRVLTMAKAAALVDDMAARMRSAGVVPGTYVAVCATHRFDIIIAACAAARLGCVPVMLAADSTGETVEALLSRLDRAAYLVTDETKLTYDLADVPLGRLVKGVLSLAGEHPGATPLSEQAPTAGRFPRPAPPNAPALVTHSSGTTGVPKLIVQSGRSLYWHYHPQVRRARYLRLYGTLATCTSFAHVRVWPLLLIAARIGQDLAFITNPDPARAADLFVETRPEIVEAFPNVFLRWEQLADDPRGPLANVRLFRSTFDAMHPRTILRMMDASRRRFCLYGQGYGQSEVGGVVSYLGTRWMVRRFGTRCVGRPLFGMARMRIERPAGSGRSTPGKIWVRSRGRAIGIIGEQEQYERRFRDGWWDMGDVGYTGRFGALYLLDREVDQVHGVDSTLSVEDQLMVRLPELVEIVVVQLDGGRPTPIVCTQKDAPLDRVRWQRATRDLGDLAPPLQVRWEDLPVTSTWKVRRPLLRRRLEEGSLPMVHENA
jgi:acyl-coenzyme A synthetase/AMP-(fatty) acid ligase